MPHRARNRSSACSLLALLVLMPTLPGCVTAAVWSGLDMRGFESQGAGGEHCIVTAPQAQLYLPLTALPASWRDGHGRAQEQWLLATPRDCAAAVAELARLVANGGAQVRSYLWLTEEYGGAPPRGVLAMSARWTGGLPGDVAQTAGLQIDPQRRTITVQGGCAIAWSTAAPPASALRADGATSTSLYHPPSIGEVAWRSAMTPFAFVADVISLPFQLIFGSMHL